MSATRWYRLGDGAVGLETDDHSLQERFDEIYGECAVAEPGGLVPVRCRVTVAAGSADIAFDDPEPLDVPSFAAAVFPGREFPCEVSSDGRSIRAAHDTPWRPFVANLAVSRVQRLQRQVMFFHAASLSVGGRGLLAFGPKRTGKTTLAMAMASRGHALLGDELAAVRFPALQLLPVRRSLAVRAGPAASQARAALDRLGPDTEIFPDGERRERAAAGSLYPPATDPVPLTGVLLLRTFADRAFAEPAAPSPALLSRLTPLAASLWNRPPGAVTVQLMRLLASARTWWIDAGPPDETAQMVEQLLETA